jgi:hypothetical protein
MYRLPLTAARYSQLLSVSAISAIEIVAVAAVNPRGLHENCCRRLQDRMLDFRTSRAMASYLVPIGPQHMRGAASFASSVPSRRIDALMRKVGVMTSNAAVPAP